MKRTLTALALTVVCSAAALAADVPQADASSPLFIPALAQPWRLDTVPLTTDSLSAIDAGNDANERRAAAPSRIAQNTIDQLIHVQRVIKQRVMWISFHLVIAEVGMGIDVVP